MDQLKELLTLPDPCIELSLADLLNLKEQASHLLPAGGINWESCRVLSGKEILKAHTFEVLSRLDIDPSEDNSEEAVGKALSIAAEKICLHLSQDSLVSADVRENLAPQQAASGLLQSLILFSISPMEIVRAESISDIKFHTIFPSAIYKPRLMSVGEVDGALLYTDGISPFYYQLGERKLGPELFPVDPNWEHEVPLLFPSVDLHKPPKHLKMNGVNFSRLSRARMAIDPGEEVLRERLFYCLSRFLGNKMQADLQVPTTSIEAFSHPAFGKHHRIGSRQSYVPGTRSLYSLYLDRQLGKATSLGEILPEEFAKAAVLHLIAASLDCAMENLLVKDNHLIAIDAGHSFPHFRGSKTDSSQHAWAFFDHANEPFPESWHQALLTVDPQEILTLFRQEVVHLNRRYPKEQFSFPSDCELTVYGGVCLLQEGIRAHLTPLQLARFQDLYTSRDLQGRPVKRKDGKELREGGEFWLCLSLACIETQTDPQTISSLSPEMCKAVRHYLRLCCEKEPQLRSASPIWEQLRRENDPLALLLKVLDGQLQF